MRTVSEARKWSAGCKWLGVPAAYVGVRRRDWIRQVAARIKKRRAEGFSVRKIADRLGVASSTVYRWLREAK